MGAGGNECGKGNRGRNSENYKKDKEKYVFLVFS